MLRTCRERKKRGGREREVKAPLDVQQEEVNIALLLFTGSNAAALSSLQLNVNTTTQRVLFFFLHV